MPDKRVIIWGAGNIGRGYVGKMFHAAGYHLVLVGRSPEPVAKLRQAGHYTVVAIDKEGQRHDEVISNYTALTTAQTDELEEAVSAADAVAVSVYPESFGDVARQLAGGLLRRRAERPGVPLDIILCANLPGAVERFRALLFEALPPEVHPYVTEHTGIVGTLVLCLAIDPPAGVPETSPLWVWTDGYGELPIDRHAFRGAIPAIPGFRLLDDLPSAEIRKLYTNNMAHAALAYLGARRGYTTNLECASDPWVMSVMEGALRETNRALQAEYHFPDDDMAEWTEQVVSRVGSPVVSDRVSRIAADPRRKLRREDRLVGPALMARRHGIRPEYLAQVIAAALCFRNPDDPGAVYVRQRIEMVGLSTAVREVCELTGAEDDLVDMIVAAYHELEPLSC